MRYVSLAIVSGIALVWLMLGEIGTGNTDVWPFALLSFIIFSCSVVLTRYYRERKTTLSLAEKEQIALSEARAEKGGEDGKK